MTDACGLLEDGIARCLYSVLFPQLSDDQTVVAYWQASCNHHCEVGDDPVDNYPDLTTSSCWEMNDSEHE